MKLYHFSATIGAMVGMARRAVRCWATARPCLLPVKSLPLLAGLILSPVAVMAVDSGYANSGIIIYFPNYSGNTVSYPPQVDATNFYNSGTWYIYTSPKPYHTADTLNYTNKGTMVGYVGWDFALWPSATGQRSMSASFFNDVLGTNQAVDDTILNPPSSHNQSQVSYLLICATNINNKGTLTAGPNGEIQLIGGNINLSRSELNITSIPPVGSFNNGTNFTPDTAVYSMYWAFTNMPAILPESSGRLTMPTMNSANLWNGTTVRVPTYGVQDNCSTNYFEGASLSFQPTTSDSLDTHVGATNEWKQAVFVYSPNIPAQIRFYPSSNATNVFQTAVVQLMAVSTNPVSLLPETHAIYWVDTLGSETNKGLNINTNHDPFYSCNGFIYRPANYNVSRTDPGGDFAGGSPGIGTPPGNFFSGFANSGVSNTYSAYSAFITNLVSQSGTVITNSATNSPGRVRICAAGNLDLTRSRIGAQGDIMIQAGNLTNSAGAVIDCQTLNYNLGSTNGYLNITNLAQQNVSRLQGTMNAWSAIWTNIQPVAVGTNTATNVVAFWVLVLDASQLSGIAPVTVQDLILHSTNNGTGMRGGITISDSMTVDQNFLLDGQSFTLLGSLNLSYPLQDWTYANAPNLRYFTNNGALFIPQDAHFGDDGPTNYAAFVNNGTITNGGGLMINSDYFQNQNSGTLYAAGGVFVTTSAGKVENASIISGEDMDFYGSTLKLNHSTLYAGNQFNFGMINSLYDTGGSSSNILICGNGFNLWIKPTNAAAGDLLGTVITNEAFNGAEVDDIWAGEDLGATTNGFYNNVAIGRLVLSPQAGPLSLFTLFYFSGASVSNALYVDYLDLTQLSTNYAEMLQIDPNLVIYYAAVTNNYAPPQAGGVDQEWEEYLSGNTNICNGHLRWVTNFAGPNSSVDVVIGGHTWSVNRALRYSKIIDSNTNGIPNYYDPDPFSNGAPPGSIPELMLNVSLVQQTGQSSPEDLVQTGQISSTTLANNVLAISWLATAGTVYQVEFATNLPPNWQPLLAYTNNTLTNQTVTVLDTNAPAGAPSRFYRVGHP